MHLNHQWLVFYHKKILAPLKVDKRYCSQSSQWILLDSKPYIWGEKRVFSGYKGEGQPFTTWFISIELTTLLIGCPQPLISVSMVYMNNCLQFWVPPPLYLHVPMLGYGSHETRGGSPVSPRPFPIYYTNRQNPTIQKNLMTGVHLFSSFVVVDMFT